MESKNFEDHEKPAYETICNVWGTDALVHVFLDGGLNKENCSLAEIVLRVNEILEIVSERGEVAKVLKRGGMIDRAEEWVYECKPANDDENCDRFIIDNGVEIQLPITLEAFADSLKVSSLGVIFNGMVDNFSAEAFICCSPDYFAGHAMEIKIKSDGSMECLGLAG